MRVSSSPRLCSSRLCDGFSLSQWVHAGYLFCFNRATPKACEQGPVLKGEAFRNWAKVPQAAFKQRMKSIQSPRAERESQGLHRGLESLCKGRCCVTLRHLFGANKGDSEGAVIPHKISVSETPLWCLSQQLNSIDTIKVY